MDEYIRKNALVDFLVDMSTLEMYADVEEGIRLCIRWIKSITPVNVWTVPDTDVGKFAKDTDVPSNEEYKSVYGYPIEQLVLFADACQKAGIDKEELKRFCDNTESAWMYAWDEFKRKQDKALRDIMSGMMGGAEDDV